MDEQERTLPEDPPATVGARLLAAREAAGLDRMDVTALTRIAERHLLSIEQDRFSDLAGRAYAIGFCRAYARAVGLDEGEIAEAIRTQLDIDEQARPRVRPETFEPGDPARVPSARLAWTAAAIGVLAVVILLYLFWPSFLSPQGRIGDPLQNEAQVQPAASETRTTGRPVPAIGTVVFTATEPQVWVKFYDAAGDQLLQKEMEEGENYTVPADAEGPLLWTARPDALAITVGGKSVARLSDKPVIVKDVPVSAEGLLARPEAPAPTSEARQIFTGLPPASTVSE